MYVSVFLLLPFAWAYAIGREIEGCRVVEKSLLMRLLGLKGMAIYPAIFVAGNAITPKGNSTVIFRHERIHVAQQRELFVLPFYVLYLLEETVRALFMGRGYAQAYFDISFEREAYANERRRTYLKRREPFAWYAYLRDAPLET